MKLLILYYSGVGNTKMVAMKIFELLHDLHEVQVASIEHLQEDINLSGNYDAFVVGFPTIHASPAEPMLRFIEQMKKLPSPVPTFLFTTCGLYSANTLRIFAKRCRKKNLSPILSKSYRCAATDGMLIAPSMKIWFQHDKELDKKIRRDVCQLITLLRGPITVKMPRFKLYSILNYPNKFFGKRFLPNIYTHKEACVICGKCIKDCPVHSIYKDSKGFPVVEAEKCIHCYRCIHHCPKKALSLSKVLSNCDEKNKAGGRTIRASDYPTELVYGTGNPAKLRSMGHFLAPLGLHLIGLKETGVILPDVDESGNSPAENAKIKAMAYYHVLRRPVFACDSGLYIDGLNESEQPGVHVRRVGGKQLNDEEMITHYAAIAKKLGGKAVARYKNAICLVISQTEWYEYSGDDISGNTFYMVDKPYPERTVGFPLDSISIHIESGEYFYSYKQTNEVGTAGIGFQNFFKRVLRIHEHDWSKK